MGSYEPGHSDRAARPPKAPHAEPAQSGTAAAHTRLPRRWCVAALTNPGATIEVSVVPSTWLGLRLGLIEVQAWGCDWG